MIKSKLREKEHEIDLEMIKMRTDTEAHSKTLKTNSITDVDEENTANDVTIVVNGRQKPPVLNDKVALRNLKRRFLVYGCQNPECLAYNIKHFDIGSS
jgi:translation initiation factor IF-3